MGEGRLPSKMQVDASRMGLSTQQIDGFASVIQDNIRNLTPVSKFPRITKHGQTQPGALRDSIKVHAAATPGGGHKFVVTMGEKYGMYLNKGFKGFIMYALAGRNVPIRLPNGAVIFRHASSTTIGQRRITARDKSTGRIMAGNRGIRWYHPGVRPMRFVERGIQASMPAMSNMYAKMMLWQMFEEFFRLTQSDPSMNVRTRRG